MCYRFLVLLGTLVVFLFAISNSASASLIVNGSFETPIAGAPQFITIPLGSEPAGFGWRITIGNVDAVIGGAIFASAAFDGLQFLDLDGTVPGGIAQSFTTIPGDTYALNFAYANNPRTEGGATVPAHATVRVFDTGSNSDLIAPLLLTHGSSTPALPDWITSGAIAFVAIGDETSLGFTSNNPSGRGGIFLDAVSVSEVDNAAPEPATLALVALGLVGVGLIRRRKRV